MKLYCYEGPVKVFGRIVSEKWYGETIAANEKKAKSNLAYQYKAKHNLVPGSKIELTGKIIFLKEVE